MAGTLRNWQRRVKKRYMALILLAVLLALGTAAALTAADDSYTLATADGREPERVEFSRDGVASFRKAERRRGLTFQAVSPGDVTVRLVYSAPGGEEVREFPLHVSEDMHLSFGPGRFAGDRMIIFSVMILFGAGTFVSFYTSIEAHRKKAFSYTMVAADALSLMLGFQTAFLLSAVLGSAEWSLSGFFQQVHAQGSRFVTLTAPVMLLLAFWLWVSNIALLRREGFSWRNMLGIGLGALWGSAYIIHALISIYGDTSNVLLLIFLTVVDYTIAYFECVLFALMLSGIRAARHQPPYDRDCIVILGCQLRRDGTLTPLLRGRVDRALSFEQRQFEATGRHAFFVPSGARGRNEVCSEAHAMAAYLKEHGVSDDRILLEEKATNTLQNMQYSRDLIHQHMPGARAAFSTTGYHVFRSMLWASRCDFECEGMGSHTKWYYYPNAYLREILGLVAAHHAVLWGLLVVIAVYLLIGLLAQM